MSEPLPTPQELPHHQRKFLVIVDETPECRVALRFAARRAQHTGGAVKLLFVVPPAGFQQWAGVARKMHEEAHEEAYRLLEEASKFVTGITGAIPEQLTREGRTGEEIRTLLKEDRAISILVLAAGTSKEGPGPLVAQIAGPAAGSYPIPVTIVPGNLSDEEVDALT